MKALITAIITTLAAFNVYALGSGSSWEDIDASYQYSIDSLSSSVVLEGQTVSIFNVCADKEANVLRTIKPATYCTNWKFINKCENGQRVCGPDRRIAYHTCSEWNTSHLAGGNLKKHCLKYHKDPDEPVHCASYEMVPKPITTEYRVNILYNYGDRQFDTAFEKRYTLEPCH